MHILFYSEPYKYMTRDNWNPPANPSIRDAAFALSLAMIELGHAVQYANPNAFTSNDIKRDPARLPDAVVIGGMFPEILKAYNERNVPSVVMDLAPVNRDQGYFYVGQNGLNWLPDHACGINRATSMNLIAEYLDREATGAVVILSQKPGDNQHNIGNITDWGTRAADAIRENTDRSIVWRSHPAAPANNAPENVDALEDPYQTTLDESLLLAHAVVTHNSTAAIQALLRGVPVVCSHAAMYHALSAPVEEIEEASPPAIEDVQHFLNRLAHTAYTPAELLQEHWAKWIVEHIAAPRDESEHDVGELLARIDQLESERSENRAQIGEFAERVDKLATGLAEAEQASVAKDKTISKLEKQIKDLKAKG